MTDSKKWKSVMMRPDTHHKLAALSKHHAQSNAAFLDWLVSREWQRCFEPLAKENPFQQPSTSTFRSRA